MSARAGAVVRPSAGAACRGAWAAARAAGMARCRLEASSRKSAYTPSAPRQPSACASACPSGQNTVEASPPKSVICDMARLEAAPPRWASAAKAASYSASRMPRPSSAQPARYWAAPVVVASSAQPAAPIQQPVIMAARPPCASIQRPASADAPPMTTSASEKPPCTKAALQPISCPMGRPKTAMR